jgi:N-acetylmuramic acid 6-phosphate etherase
LKRRNESGDCAFLGIECGGTRTVALLVHGDRPVKRIEFGPANLRLLSNAELGRHFRALGATFTRPTAIAIGMAGARTPADKERIRRCAARVWPRVPCYASHDLEVALTAAELQTSPVQVNARRNQTALVLVLSGTGSCCFGRSSDGKKAKVGGWGHLLGDKGSGYEIGLRSLKAVVYYHDRDGIWSTLGQHILRALQLNEPEDLIGWVQNAGKTEIAALALEVFRAWAKRDKIAADILEGAAHSLAKDAATCAKRLVGIGSSACFVLAGGILLNQPRFAKLVERQLRQLWPRASISRLKRESVWGAVELAKRQIEHRRPVMISGVKQGEFPSVDATVGCENLIHSDPAVLPESSSLSPTEQRNPRSMSLDELSIEAAIELMLREDAKIPRILLRERKRIETAIQLIVRAFRREGRLFYVGAGTSGRLGILDATECPPTFSVSVDQVQGIIAGGQQALWTSVEGAEDDPAAGAQAIRFRGVQRRDVVVGIAASGRTPFVWGAFSEAKKRGATTILLCFNPFLRIARSQRPHLIIAPNLGPEILTGSTRLKAGTATKLILNLFTTLAMVRSGKVSSNLMVDVKASNRKLRDRAVRITMALSGADYAAAQSALERSRWRIKSACRTLVRKKRFRSEEKATSQV